MSLITKINLSDKDIIALDFFDTTVHRNCHPETILFEWSKKIAFYFDYNISPSEVYSLRKICEKNGKIQTQLEDIPYKELLLSIFNNLKERLSLVDNDLESFLAYARKIEEKIELKYLYVDQETLEFLEHCYNNKKNIVLISDFYTDKIFIESLMEQLNIRRYFSHVFISSEIGLRKSTGNLYKYVIDYLQVKPENILMVGDNKISDIEKSSELGVQVFYKPYQDHYRINNKQDIITKFEGIMKSAGDSSLFDLYLPEVMYFISNLHRTLIRDNVNNVLFCSREGQFLKKIFDIYQHTLDLPNIKSKYFYVSRKATLYPSFDSLDRENFDIIFRQYDNLSLENFLLNLDFSMQDIQRISQETDIALEQNISKNSICLSKLKNNTLFVNHFETKRQKELLAFLSYLKGIGIQNDTGKMVIVDIGWKGTIQDSIQRALPNVELSGYYLGLNFKRYNTSTTKYKVGILFSDYPMTSPFFNLFNYKYLFYERMFVADHGPTIGYEMKDGSAVPVIDSDRKHLNIWYKVAHLQSSFVDTFETTLNLFINAPILPYELLHDVAKLSLKKHVIYAPKNWQSIQNLDIAVQENFGIITGNLKHSPKIKNLWSNRNFLFIDYVYKLFGRNTILDYFITVYAYLVYFIKYLQLIVKGDL